MDISDPQTNMMIIVFIGGLVGNGTYTFLKWWQAKGQFEAEGIPIKFDNRFIVTAVISFIPVVILTGAGFTSLLNLVNASNPVSYAAAFITAFTSSILANYVANKQVTANIPQKNELNLKIIEKHAKLYEFNQKIKNEGSNESSA